MTKYPAKKKKELLQTLEKLRQDLSKATDKRRVELLKQSIKDCERILKTTKE
jgi:hypothetical protein